MKRIIIALAAMWLAGGMAAAQDSYPSRTVRLLCWSSAGSPLDVMMRQLGRQLADLLGQPFVVENRPGGEGGIAMAALLNSPADGYTILSTTSSMSFAMATRGGRHTPHEFTVLPALQSEPSAVAVRADSPFKTVQDFIAAVRAQPERISVGGFSSAGFHQYVYYRMQQMAGFKSIWVPFKGGGDAATALLGGHIQASVMTPSSALSQIQNGDIRLIAVSSAKRDEYLPEVPTFKEQGLDIVEALWRGVMVRADTPRPIVDKLIEAMETIKRSKEWQEFSRQNMQSSVTVSLDGMQRQVREEVAAYRAFLETVGAAK
ncbi:Bug family tripartite tricarboxylate transporter substrate binding protein [Rhodoplanes sp. Z2-YC6860]|uniref:Bug family tripartite tricarboxylate transporter substrate binding protein n=1 Tax=Rhodoplanes sp. Z2-YC6860 TaxID=674703 RepID=UPI00078E4533|nr:tripartite tricarboxylate transporter substrate binding protein [Rhodoplanes sp. Z2-YC6860]AMN44378.1 tripartite tricarboxylate transporter receptor family protein [Rhodoplanes sp. Z2-YC6860]